MFKNVHFFCKVNQQFSGEVHSKALQYDGKSNDSKYNQLPTAAKRKTSNIPQALIDSSKLCYLKLIWIAYEMAQIPSMPHRQFQVFFKIQWENGSSIGWRAQ